MYDLIKFFLFLLPAELSHTLGLKGLNLLHKLGLTSLLTKQTAQDSGDVFGLHFPNRVGLAAGLDKNGDYIDALGALGFGFIEVGTVTPLPQAGNPKPRLFRLKAEESIINRMGFNNKGVDYMVARLQARSYKGLVGVNIGKNFATPVENALDDYLICLQKVYAYADYIVVNLSSPNTPGLRSLQFGEPLDQLLQALKQEQGKLQVEHQKQVPLLLKIAPDLESDEVQQIAQSLLKYKVEGVIATNTTVSRESVPNSQYANEQGGLSGTVLAEKSTQVINQLAQSLQGQIPIIGVGGIVDADTARAKVAAGASLIQLYSGLIFKGPGLIARAIASLDRE